MTRFQGDWNTSSNMLSNASLVLQYDPISRGLKLVNRQLQMGDENYNMTRFQGDWNTRGKWVSDEGLDYNMTRFQGDWNNVLATGSW